MLLAHHEAADGWLHLVCWLHHAWAEAEWQAEVGQSLRSCLHGEQPSTSKGNFCSSFTQP